jgi:hypothetical protein
MNAGTKPYSETESKADPGMYAYETDPRPKPRMRVIPNKGKNDIVLLNALSSEEVSSEEPNIIHAADYQEGMSSMHPVVYESSEMTTNFYMGALSVVGLFILFRVLYSR